MVRLRRLLTVLVCAATAAVLLCAPVRAGDITWRDAMSAAGDATLREDHASAAVHYTQALAAASQASQNANVAAALYGLGRAKRALHDYAQAEQSYQRALAIVETTPVDGVSRADVLQGLGDVFRMQGRYSASEASHLRALALTEHALGPAHPKVAEALTIHLASLYRVQARFDEAEAAYKRALAILENSVRADDPRLGLALIDLGEWHYERNRYAEAEPLYRRGIPIVQKMLPSAHPRVLELLQDWGRVRQLQGRYAEAEATYKEMQRLAEQHHGKDHSLVAAAFTNLAGVYEVQGREAEAQAARARALELAEFPFRTYPYAPNVGAQGQAALKSGPLVLAPPAPMVLPSADAQPALTPAPARPPLFSPSLRVFPGLRRR